MSTPPKITTRRLRQLKQEADKLTDAEELAKDDILVFIHEAKAEGVSHAAIAGMFLRISASGVPAKAEMGAEILAERKSQRKAKGG